MLVCRSLSRIAAVVIALTVTSASAEHPQVLVRPADHDEIVRKLQTADWAEAGYAKLHERLDPVVQRAQADPEFAASRLFMNWDTHYVTPLVADSKTVGGEGHAPIPTPRFAGARNWVTDYIRPVKLEDWTPYNDRAGKVCLPNEKTHQMDWVDPGITGRTFENGNEQIMGLAADAAFVYWLDGDERYAKFAAHILTTYMDGFALMQPPKAVDNDAGMMTIIGPTSFEVIHEGLVVQVSMAYDFLQPYLRAHSVDTMPIELGLKRWAQRVTDGGGRDGNWNLNEAVMITYAALALENDDHYPDHRGRQHYVDVVLNADLPHHTGLTRVIQAGLDPKSKLWPEAAGYGFGSTTQILELSYLLSAEPSGAKVLDDPLLAQSVMAQRQLLYPNGLSEGVGDTTNTRLSASALELLIAHARRTGDHTLEQRMTAQLQHEMATGNYQRDGRSDLFALTQYVDLARTDVPADRPDRTFWFYGLNILMQRNGDDPTHGLAAALYGTDGGHIHANGMAVELYGAGYIMGADPGRGASYWSPDHHGYYTHPPAHNTVVINGTSDYDEYKSSDKRMSVAAVEPMPGAAGLSPNVSFARGTFVYAKPSAEQQRTLALIRTDATHGFYFDVFRSKTLGEQARFQDYIYHNMGQSVTIDDVSLSQSDHLQDPALQKAYTYFKDERSAPFPGDLRATFELRPPNGPTAMMSLWMPAEPGRTVFAVNAPKNNAIRDGIAAELRDMPMPTVIVRQNGQAWDAPFVAVYEPFTRDDGSAVQAVADAAPRTLGLVATTVRTMVSRILLLEDSVPQDRAIDGVTFHGTFGVIFGEPGKETELYLGQGREIGSSDVSLSASSDVAVDVRKDGADWVVNTTGALSLSLPFSANARQLLLDGHLVQDVQWTKHSGQTIASFKFPGPVNGRLTTH